MTTDIATSDLTVFSDAAFIESRLHLDDNLIELKPGEKVLVGTLQQDLLGGHGIGQTDITLSPDASDQHITLRDSEYGYLGLDNPRSNPHFSLYINGRKIAAELGLGSYIPTGPNEGMQAQVFESKVRVSEYDLIEVRSSDGESAYSVKI